MDVFRFLAEQRIQEAIDQGAFDDIKGKGRPLDLNFNPHIPPELRAAFKLLQDAGIRPREVDLMKEIAGLKGSLEKAEKKNLPESHTKWIKQRLADAQTELDLLLGRNIPCGCSRSKKKRSNLAIRHKVPSVSLRPLTKRSVCSRGSPRRRVVVNYA